MRFLKEWLLVEMPEKVDKMKLSQEQDRRRKLTDDQKEEIRKLYATGMYSLNSLAREYNVSKKTILLIVNPDSKAKEDARIKAHWRDYYDREEHNQAVKNLRNYKKDLLKKGELKESIEKPTTLSEEQLLKLNSIINNENITITSAVLNNDIIKCNIRDYTFDDVGEDDVVEYYKHDFTQSEWEDIFPIDPLYDLLKSKENSYGKRNN